MMIQKIAFYYFFIILSMSAFTQISGTVKDPKGESLIGVNVYLKNTYDGATTDPSGNFSFQSAEQGEQILICSFVGFETREIPVTLPGTHQLEITLKETVGKLTGVTIYCRKFEASDESKTTILKPLDIAMTAGATADIQQR